MLHILNEQVDNSLVKENIAICKSESGIIGTKLRNAHDFLGGCLAATYTNYFSKDSVVITLLRAGLPLAYGFANKLDCTILFYDDKVDNDFFERNKTLLENKDVIFADSVINSGKSILEAIKKSNLPKLKIKIITNVLCYKALDSLTEYELFAVRVSRNSFKGENVAKQKNGIGPDTGDRLFKTMCGK